MKIGRFICLGLVAGFFLATAAQAQMSMSGFYAGAGVGQARYKDACEGFPGSCDDKDTAWKIFAGYQFNENFGAELGYVDLGTAKGTTSVAFLGVPAGSTVNIDVKTFELVGVGTFPINNDFGVFGKLGIHRWDADFSGFIPGLGAGSFSDDGTDLTFGVGLQWNFMKEASARLYWQRYNDVGDENTTGKTDLDVFGVSALFRF